MLRPVAAAWTLANAWGSLPSTNLTAGNATGLTARALRGWFQS